MDSYRPSIPSTHESPPGTTNECGPVGQRRCIRLQIETVPTSPLMTEGEAIAYLRLDTIDVGRPQETLARYRKAGLLRGTQVSKRVFYLKHELDEFLRRLTDQNPR
jgi:hypothetical protein